MERITKNDFNYKSHESYSIDPNRIVNKELLKIERYLCNLCKNVLMNTKKCNLCSSHFCSDCIIKYQNEEERNSNYCPICHTINYKIEEGEKYLMKFIDDLSIKCKYITKGCTEICYYQNILEHENICKYREKICDNCKYLFDYNYYYQHLIDCYKISEPAEHHIQQQKILMLIKAFDEKISKIKYDNKYGINTLKLEMQKSMNKLDEKIRILEKYTSEQDFLIKTIGLEKFKLNSPHSIYGKNFKECQVYYYCKGGYNGCNKSGNVWGSNPYTSDSIICLGALHSGNITKEGGLFIVKKGGPLESYIGSIKNGVNSQSYGSFDHMLILPSELDIKISSSNTQCGPRIGICKGKANNCFEKGDVWGENPYVRESNFCKAALHSGMISENGGIFMIEDSGTHGGYVGCTKNSISSLHCPSNRASITIKPFLPY